MTPKEKAINLADKFMLRIVFNIKQNIEVSVIESAKQCALIAVEEILNSNPSYDDYGGNGWIIIDNSEYWKEVKEEINKL